MAEEKGKLSFKHHVLNEYIKDGAKSVHEEKIYQGSKGLTIKFFYKDGRSKIRYTIKQADGKYLFVINKNENAPEQQTLTKDELIKAITGIKELKFALDFLKTAKGLSRQKVSRGTPKKASSRKSSRKASSRKGSRKSSSRKGSRKGSRK